MLFILLGGAGGLGIRRSPR